jgi:gamma-glutamyl-gamma-aminobutyraldehyde dehydrogenase
MFLRSHDEFSQPGLLAGKSENWRLKRAYLLTANIAPPPIIPPFETIDPAAQQTLAGSRGKKADVDRAVKAARGVLITATGRRPLLPSVKRCSQIRRPDGTHREELALLETLDTGKPIRHSLRDDIPGAARAIRWYAEALDKVYGEVAPTGGELAMIVREPIGVIAAVVPWNFPLLLACWKLGPALAAGNSVVLKPSEKSPLTALRLAGWRKRPACRTAC